MTVDRLRYLAQRFIMTVLIFVGQGHRSKFKVRGTKCADSSTSESKVKF